MYSRGSVFIHALHPWQLISSNIPGIDNTMYFCIGFPILICLLSYVLVKKYIPLEYKSFYKFFAILGIVTTIMSTALFPWFLLPDILLMIQFPWRLLSIIILCFSIIGGINLGILIDLIIGKIKNRKNANNYKSIKSSKYTMQNFSNNIRFYG